VADAPLVKLDSGLEYRESKIGGGVAPKVGDFVGVNVVVSLGDVVLLDSKAPGGRPIAFTFGKRPYAAPICVGVEQVRMQPVQLHPPPLGRERTPFLKTPIERFVRCACLVRVWCDDDDSDSDPVGGW